MKKESLDSVDLVILKILHGTDSLSSNEIWRETGANRNKTLKKINRLITGNFLHVENGKKCLTEEGRLALLQNDVNGLREILERINVLTQEMISEPEMLGQLRETERGKIREFAGAKDLPLEKLPERLEELFQKDSAHEKKKQRIMKIINAYSGPFRRTLRNMHLISPYLASPKTREGLSGEVYIHVTKEGAIDALSEDEIDELLREAPHIQPHTF